MLRLPTIAVTIAALVGCSFESMTPAWQLDRTRLLAARATPAEPVPGDAVTMETLAWSPEGEVGLMWFLCWEQAIFTDRCEPDEAQLAELRALDWTALEGEELATWRQTAMEAGVFGVEPGWEPTLPLPAELLALLEIPELSEGLSLALQVQAWPLSDPEGDLEHAVKYLPVSLAETPNHNPDLDGVLVDGAPLPAGEVLAAEAGVAYEIEATPAEDAVETYTYTTSEGETEEREEEPSTRWYATAGDLAEEWGGPFGDGDGGTATWTAPDDAGEGIIVVVILDQRGGMGWAQVQWTVPAR